MKYVPKVFQRTLAITSDCMVERPRTHVHAHIFCGRDMGLTWSVCVCASANAKCVHEYSLTCTRTRECQCINVLPRLRASKYAGLRMKNIYIHMRYSCATLTSDNITRLYKWLVKLALVQKPSTCSALREFPIKNFWDALYIHVRTSIEVHKRN